MAKVQLTDGSNTAVSQKVNSNGSTNVVLVDSSALDAIAVTPSDSADLSKGITKGIYVGVAGDVKVTLSSGAAVVFTGLAAGMIHPIAAKRIWATGTTATNILAVY